MQNKLKNGLVMDKYWDCGFIDEKGLHIYANGNDKPPTIITALANEDDFEDLTLKEAVKLYKDLTNPQKGV